MILKRFFCEKITNIKLPKVIIIMQKVYVKNNTGKNGILLY